MANWIVSDELDARLRERLGDAGLAEYVESFFQDQLDYEEDPAYRARVDAQILASEADIAAGRVMDARDAMRKLAADKGFKFDR